MNMSKRALPQDVCEKVHSLLKTSKVYPGSVEGAAFTVEKLGGDGSNRRFWRLALADGPRVIVIAPENLERKCLKEADAVYYIGSHLRSCNVPVPEIFGYDTEGGIVLCEDLGQMHLHSIAIATDWQDAESVERLRRLYRQVLDVLVTMQTKGREGFNPDWCWDTRNYDRPLMLERESGYFLRAFWQGMLERPVPGGLAEEFSQLADAAASAPNDYFLHRDFQSRNVMVINGAVRVIDFQGGRFGPLAYDLASLLLDPYAALPEVFQAELYSYYLERLANCTVVDAEKFRTWYRVLALQRNLQILGAYSYLSAVVGKPFFRTYIVPALISLLRLSMESCQPHLPILESVARQGLELTEISLK